MAFNTVSAQGVDTGHQLKSWKTIPSLSSLPVIGQLKHFLPGGYLYESEGQRLWEKLHEKFGPITILKAPLKPPMLVVMDANLTAEIVRNENWSPVRPGLQSLDYFRRHYHKYGDQASKPVGLATDQGEIWRQFRTKVNPFLMLPSSIKCYANAVDEVADDMIKRLRSLRDENNRLPANFDHEMNLWALESIAKVGLGRRFNCFDPNLSPNDPAKKFIQGIHDMFEASDKIDIKTSLWHYYPTKNFKAAMKVYAALHNVLDEFVEESLRLKQTKTTTDYDSNCVLDKLLQVDEHIARVMASDMLVGGVDTTANAMATVLYLLAKNPEKQNKLRDSLKSKQKPNSYLTACIKESLRVKPLVDMYTRETTKKYNLLGYEIPEGVNTLFCVGLQSKMEANYPRPSEYIPERWTVDVNHPLSYKNANPFAYAPFGFGVRSCVGRRMVMMELETFLAKVIENFEVSWSGPPPSTKTVTINYLIGPYHFIFKDL